MTQFYLARKTSLPLPLNKANLVSSNCSEWEQRESRKNFEPCLRSLEDKKYAYCPRQHEDLTKYGMRRTVIHRGTGHTTNEYVALPDAFWANREVKEGNLGWRYDQCCSNDNPAERQLLHDAEICHKDYCQFRIGADFCIFSDTVNCIDGASFQPLTIINQCCYEKTTGRLLDETDNPASSGSIHMANSAGSSNPTTRAVTDYYPYESCCSVHNSCPSPSLALYKQHRPNFVGEYKPGSRPTSTVYIDPHLITLDGSEFAFMGVGVYTLFTTSFDGSPLTAQVSLRRMGNGSVISGLAVLHNQVILEMFVTEQAQFKAAVNGEFFETGKFLSYSIEGVTIQENADDSSYKFGLFDSGIEIKVSVTGNLLNLFTSVSKEYYGKLNGLLGYFDGDEANDFTASSKS